MAFFLSLHLQGEAKLFKYLRIIFPHAALNCKGYKGESEFFLLQH